MLPIIDFSHRLPSLIVGTRISLPANLHYQIYSRHFIVSTASYRALPEESIRGRGGGAAAAAAAAAAAEVAVESVEE